MSREYISVGDRRVGSGERVFVIAEAGINHNGDINRAMELIDRAHEAGACAVKFQKRDLAEVYQKKILENPNAGEQKYRYLIPLLKEFELPDEAFVEMEKYANEKGIIFLVNPWDKKSADAIEKLLNVPVYKIGSPDFTNNELLEYVAKFGKDMILSTGMSKEEEIKKGVEFMEGLGVKFALMHCNNSYPAPFDEINLRFMERLKEFGRPVGYSGHERGVAVAIAAVARGASIIERHLTVDNKLEGPDHRASLMPEEFKEMVKGIREVEQALGKPEKRLSQIELMNRELLGKSLVAKEFIADGAEITRSMITTKSPAKGLSPQRVDEVVGVVARRDIPAGTPITEDDLTADEVQKSFDGSDIKWKWGPIVRWHDFNNYLKYEPDLFEFHLSDKDLDEPVPKGSFSQAVVVHVPEYMGRVYLNPAAQDSHERKVAVETLKRSLAVTRQLGESFQGKPKMVLHPGGITLQPAEDKESIMNIFRETMEELKSDDVEILPENLPPRPWVFGGEWAGNIWLETEEIKKFLEEMGLMMCFDISHAALACNARGQSLTGMVKTLRPYISHLHVSDAFGIGDEGLQIGEGSINWKEVMRELEGYDQTMVPEIWQGHLHEGKGFLQAMNHLKVYMK
jgi:N-acetylneuraminate synthase